MNKKYVVIKTIAIFLCWLCIVSVTGCSSKEQSNSNELQTVISAGTTDDTEATEDWFADINSVSSEEISDALVDIDVNQVGYQPDDKKIAIVHNDYGSDTYTIVDESGNTVFSGRLSGYIMDNVTNEQVRIADFSNFCMPGTFYVMCGDESESFPFQIDDELYGEKIQGIIETLLGMHSEWTLEESAMNNEMDIATVGVTSIYNSEETKEVTGGWQATKESGRYVISACKSCADLLLAYELYGEGLSQELTSMKDKTLGNVILEEVKYEVNWMLKMQDEDTGAVYTKVSGRYEGDSTQWVFSPSTNATGDFAAVMAMCSRIYQSEDKNFAQDCLGAAKKAWTFLENNKNLISFENPDGVTTKEFADSVDADERYWAACELYKATGNGRYREYISEYMNLYGEQSAEEEVKSSFRLTEVSGYGDIAYLTTRGFRTDEGYKEKINAKIVEVAEWANCVEESEPYGVVIGDKEGQDIEKIASDATLLMLAGTIQGNKDYVQLASRYVDYLLGANPSSINYMDCLLGEEKDENTIEFVATFSLLLAGCKD